MNYTISYPKEWSSDGTTYDQKISATVSFAEWFNLTNKLFLEKRKTIQNQMYLHRIHIGKNYTTLTTRDFFCKHFGIRNKRLLDRNTIIDLQIVR